MDLASLKPVNEPQRLVLLHPKTGEDLTANGKPIAVLVKGVDHPDMVAFERKLSQRRYQKIGRTGRLDMDADEEEAKSLERVIEAVAGWENMVYDGADLPFSKEKLREIIQALPFVRDQVEGFYRDRGNFIGGAQPPTAKK